MNNRVRTSVLRALGKTVKRLRLERSLSQEELASRARLHRTYISDIERGDRNVALLNIVKLASALGVEVTDLLAEIRVPSSRA